MAPMLLEWRVALSDNAFFLKIHDQSPFQTKLIWFTLAYSFIFVYDKSSAHLHSYHMMITLYLSHFWILSVVVLMKRTWLKKKKKLSTMNFNEISASSNVQIKTISLNSISMQTWLYKIIVQGNLKLKPIMFCNYWHGSIKLLKSAFCWLQKIC